MPSPFISGRNCKKIIKNTVSKPQTCNDEAEETASLQSFDATNNKALSIRKKKSIYIQFYDILVSQPKCPWMSWSIYLPCAHQHHLHLPSQSSSQKCPTCTLPLWPTGSQFFPLSSLTKKKTFSLSVLSRTGPFWNRHQQNLGQAWGNHSGVTSVGL